MAAAWPLPGIDDTHSTSWADYGVTTGIWRLLDVLAEAGYRWTGDHSDHDLPQLLSTAHGLLVSLMHSDCSDVRDAAAGPYAYRDLHRELLDHMLAAPGPGVFRLTVHAHVGGRPLLAGMAGQILDHIRESGDVWVATHAQGADGVARYARPRTRQGRAPVDPLREPPHHWWVIPAARQCPGGAALLSPVRAGGTNEPFRRHGQCSSSVRRRDGGDAGVWGGRLLRLSCWAQCLVADVPPGASRCVIRSNKSVSGSPRS